MALTLSAGVSLTPVQAQPVWQSHNTALGVGNTATVAKPAGTGQGDLLVIGIMFEKGTDTTITASGWTLIRRADKNTDVGMATYWKRAGASEPATYSLTLTNAPKWSIGISRVTNTHGTDPILASRSSTGNGGSDVTAPSINTTVDETLVLAFYTNKKPATYTAAADTSEQYDEPYVAQGMPSNMLATFAQLSAGATGDKVATASEGAEWIGQQVVVRAPPPPPTGFNAFETSTAPSALTGVIRTRRAGLGFSLDLLAIRNGAKYSAFAETVKVELIGNNTLGVTLDADDCPTSSTVLQTQSSVAIPGGRTTIAFTAVANSWRDVRVRVSWPESSPTMIRCSTDNFAIRPDRFAAFAVTDTDWQTPGTGRSLNGLTFGAVTHNAGRPFTVRATAVNAAGSPAITTNYTETPSSTLSACAGAACTASFGTLALGEPFSAGVLNSSLATYDNVGAFRMQLVDADFASVDASDGSTAAEREITSVQLDVGRFVPDHFAAALNTPSFATACGPGGFTYVGELFSYASAPVITVTAQDYANNPTTLYAGNWWRITGGSLTGKAYAAASGALDTSGITGTDPLIVDIGGGTGTLTFGSGSGFSFTRSTPVAPFDAEISLAINVIDGDGVTYSANPARFGEASAGNGIAFDSGKSMRFGRLALRNANGSQLVPLKVHMEAQYAVAAGAGVVFVTNKDDSCTSLANNNVQMSSFTANLAACETAVSGAGTLSGGRRTLILPPPGNANTGSVLLTANLDESPSGTTCITVGGGTVSAAGADLTYLQGAWSGSDYDDDPSARAAFGTKRGVEEVIFVRENF